MITRAALTSSATASILGEIQRSESRFVLDLSKYTSASLTAVTYLLVGTFAWQDRAEESEPIRVEASSALTRYLDRSGAAELCSPAGTQALRLSSAGSSGAARFLMPFQAVALKTWADDFESECNHLLNRLYDAVTPALRSTMLFTEGEVRSFWLASKEIIYNIYEHSASWGFGAMEAMPKGFVLVYADLGVGIPYTLKDRANDFARRFHWKWSDARALEGAFEFGVSDRVSGGRGTGLHSVREFVERSGGAIECRSASALLQFKRGGIRARAVPAIPGTQISLYLPRKNRGV